MPNDSSDNTPAAPSPALTVKQLAAKYPAFTESSVRWLIFGKKRNGFDRCLISVGRRVLIDEGRFLEYLRSCREVAA